LRGELAGIFNWALVELDRLRNQDAFTKPAISEAEKQQYKRDANPARAWLVDTYEEGEARGASEITRRSLYEAYQAMAKEEGLVYKLAMASFNREVRTAFPAAKETQVRRLGEAVRLWQHIREKA